MKRILCIWLPNWPLQRLFHARPELKRRTVALYETRHSGDRQGGKIVASNHPAIVRGMPVAEAAALVALHLERHDPAADRSALEKLAEACQAFSPLVALEDAAEPESLYLDITGLASLLGDEPSLAQRTARWFAERGLTCRLAVADSWGAAWAVAHYGDELSIVPPGGSAAAIAPLPVESLRLSDKTVATLAELGIDRVEQLAALPRSGLASRFAPLLLLRLDQAAGHAPETLAAHQPPPEIVVERELEYPLAQREAVEAILADLVRQAADALAARQRGAVRLACRLGCQGGDVRIDVGLFQPSANADHLRELLQLRLERVALCGPLSSLRLAVVVAAPLAIRQRDLFDAEDDHARQFALLVDRLAGRLGRDAVVRAVPVADAQPEYAVRYEPLAAGKHRPAKTPPVRPRPLLIEPQPIPLEALTIAPHGVPAQFRFRGREHRVVASWGPERIQTGWWRGQYIRRDYYRVATAGGQRFWLFHSRGKWFLHGVFD